MNEPHRNAASSIISATMVLSISYAVVRYNIVGDVPWNALPFYVLNKGLCLGAFILLSFNFSLGPAKNLGIPIAESWLNARKAMGMSGFLLILMHTLMSFMLFTPNIFSKFFLADGALTGQAGLSMLAGIMAFVFLWGYNMSFQTFLREDKAFITFITSRKCLIWALTLGGLHLFFMGYSGWLNPSAWTGGLPPISLVAFIVFITGYTINFFGRK
jgi:hypothetical protein